VLLKLLCLFPLLFQFGETVKVNYVLVPVGVADKHGVWMTGLKKSDFELQVDTHPVPIEHFSLDTSQPVSTVVMVDASGSMGEGGQWERILRALEDIAANLKPQDELAVSVFQSRSVRLLRPLSTGELHPAELMKDITPWGKTALYDALAYIPVYTAPARYPKTQVILITDTHDNYSEQNPQTVIDHLLQVKVPVFTLTLRQTPEEIMEIDFLKILAKYSGGSVETANAPAEIEAALDHIRETISKQYLLGFAPSQSSVIEYHSIQVNLKKIKGAAVTAKKGYLGGPPKYAD
jgi:VWFA-related protein